MSAIINILITVWVIGTALLKLVGAINISWLYVFSPILFLFVFNLALEILSIFFGNVARYVEWRKEKKWWRDFGNRSKYLSSSHEIDEHD